MASIVLLHADNLQVLLLYDDGLYTRPQAWPLTEELC